MGVFHVFKLYIWYEIAQNITNCLRQEGGGGLKIQELSLSLNLSFLTSIVHLPDFF